MSLLELTTPSVDDHHPNSGFEWFRDPETDNTSVLAFRVPELDHDGDGDVEEEEEREDHHERVLE